MYVSPGPTREEIDATKELALVEFGTNWCGHCQGAQPIITEALASLPAVKNRIMVEDGPGRRLGRSFHVKLWPTLIFIKDGVEIGRVVRPQNVKDILDAVRM